MRCSVTDLDDVMPAAAPVEVSERQFAILRHLMECPTNPHYLVERARVLVYAASGLGRIEAADRARLGPRGGRHTVRKWCKRWNARPAGLDATDVSDSDLERGVRALLSDAPRSGAPPKFTPEQVAQIIALACESPDESGRPVTHWTAEDLADEAVRRGIVESISRSTVSGFLK